MPTIRYEGHEFEVIDVLQPYFGAIEITAERENGGIKSILQIYASENFCDYNNVILSAEQIRRLNSSLPGITQLPPLNVQRVIGA